MDDYIVSQIAKIKEWKEAEPSVIAQGFGLLLRPLVWAFNQIVPASALESIIHGADWLSEYTIPEVSEESSDADLAIRDSEASEVQNWAIAAAVGEGAAAGWFGFLSAPVDIPAVILLSLRTVRRVGLCYGYGGTDETERQFVLGVLGSAGANSMQEKIAALYTLSSVQRMIATQTFKKMAEKAAETTLSKEAAVIAIRDLAKQVGVNLTKRKLLAAIPVIGSVVGGSINGWYIRDIGIAAQRAYQERWLRERGQLLDQLPDAPTAEV